jgi:hypothetical protein
MRSDVPLLEEIAAKFPWLLHDLGFHLVTSDRRVGDSVVILQSDILRLRLMRERGMVYAELASALSSGKWWDLEFVCPAISVEMPKPELESIAIFLQSMLPVIKEAFDTKLSETERKLEEQIANRQRVLERQFPKTARWGGIPRVLQTTVAGQLLTRVLFWILIGYAIWAFVARDASRHVPADRGKPVIKVSVLADGRLTVNEMPSSIESLRADLRRLHDQDGTVWYYREKSERELPPIAKQVLDAVIEAHLPIRLSSHADFSDSISLSNR